MIPRIYGGILITYIALLFPSCRMETNLTMLVKSINDSKVVSHLVLPNKHEYSVAMGLQYNKQLDIIQHLLVFSRPEDSPCYTLSDVSPIEEHSEIYFMNGRFPIKTFIFPDKSCQRRCKRIFRIQVRPQRQFIYGGQLHWEKNAQQIGPP